VIHQQIEDTRSDLTRKLETLEAEVKDTVESAKEAVEDTFTSAKETVQETISSVKETMHNASETVKRTFNISYQVDRHPWGMLGLSFVSGIIGGALLGGRMRPGRRVARRMAEASDEPYYKGEASTSSSRLTHDGASRPGFFDRLTSQVGGEFEKIQDSAINTVVKVVGDVAKKAIPALGAAFEDMMARTASQCGVPPQQHGEEEPGTQATAGSRFQSPPMY